MTVAFASDRQPARLAPPRPLVDAQTRLILFSMHRCGSTTGQRWFFELAGWRERMVGKGAGELSAMWAAEHPEVYRHLGEHCRDPSFLRAVIVRHPFYRAVSSYTVVTDSKSGAQWEAAAKSLQAPDDNRRLTFMEFLDFLETEDLANANHHWRLQTAQDWQGMPIASLQIVRLESIRMGLDRVCRMLGKKPAKVHLNSAQSICRTTLPASKIVNFTRADFARAFGRDRRGIIRFPDYSNFFTPEAIQRLARLYKQDFESFGYALELPPAPNRFSGLRKLFTRN